MQVCQSADHFVTHEGASSQFSPRSSRNIGSSLIRPNNDGPYQLELMKMMFNSRFLAKRPDCLILPETLPRNIIQRSFVPVSHARARARIRTHVAVAAVLADATAASREFAVTAKLHLASTSSGWNFCRCRTNPTRLECQEACRVGTLASQYHAL